MGVAAAPLAIASDVTQATAAATEERRRGTLAHTRNGMISSATMFATLIIGLMAGPAVSL